MIWQFFALMISWTKLIVESPSSLAILFVFWQYRVFQWKTWWFESRMWLEFWIIGLCLSLVWSWVMKMYAWSTIWSLIKRPIIQKHKSHEQLKIFYSVVPDLGEIAIKPLEPDLYSATTAKPITNAGKERFWSPS